MNTLPELTHSISKHSIRIWRTMNLIIDLFILILCTGLLITSYYFHWYPWMIVILWVGIGLTLLGMIWTVMVEPKWKYTYWSYGFNEHFIRFQHGRLFSKQVVIPMSKIQFVETEQGPLLRRNQVETVTIGTMGKPHKIPMLMREDAHVLKKHIATYAQIKEVDE